MVLAERYKMGNLKIRQKSKTIETHTEKQTSLENKVSSLIKTIKIAIQPNVNKTEISTQSQNKYKIL